MEEQNRRVRLGGGFLWEEQLRVRFLASGRCAPQNHAHGAGSMADANGACITSLGGYVAGWVWAPASVAVIPSPTMPALATITADANRFTLPPPPVLVEWISRGMGLCAGPRGGHPEHRHAGDGHHHAIH